MTTTLFDIAADLDTPVSAYLKSKPFRPALPAGERRGRRASGPLFLHRLRRLPRVPSGRSGLTVNGVRAPRPTDQAQLLASLRAGPGAGAPPRRRSSGFPAARRTSSARPVTTWCATSRDCQPRPSRGDGVPDAHYVAPALRAGVRSPHAARGPAARRSRERTAARCVAKSSRRCAEACRGRCGRRNSVPARASLSQDAFLHNVARTKEYIAAGDVYQLVLSIRFGGLCDMDPFEAYRALRLLNPSPYIYYLRARRPRHRGLIA